MKYIQDDFKILTVNKLNSAAFDFTIEAPEIAERAKAGQFVNILCDGKTLRRPISLCGIDKSKGTIRIVFEVRGEGTLWLSERKEGDIINVLGPLGNGFPADEKYENVVFVGGGIGVPPLLETSKVYGKKADAILGFRSKSALILEDDFKEVCENVYVTTDDGSYGHHGFVTDILKERLEKPCDAVFACGPGPMLKNVAAMAEAKGIPCFVSLEERMGCGIGACLVCACKTKEKDGEHYRHVCKNGPVFDSREVVWNG